MQGFAWCNRIPRKGGIGNYPSKSNFRERTRCPSSLRRLFKPSLGCLMELVRRPHQRDERVHVEQARLHSGFDSSSRTFLHVTFGESPGRSKTCCPFTSRVGRLVSNPFRTRSETARPRLTDRLFA